MIFDARQLVIQMRLTMKTASIRDLRNSFPTVARWIEEGESVEITRSGKPFARLEPIKPEPSRSLIMPDFLARMRNHFPAEKPGNDLSSVVDYDRGDQ
jgi:antitoxin (DNA-binding transcriptional repressor) of toxin-antitoxin stability system